MQYALKVLVSALLIVVVAEISKRSSLLGSVLASLPVISLLAIIWLYLDTGDIEKIAQLSNHIFWLVFPSLIFFISLPLCLKKMDFWPSLILSSGLTTTGYFLMVFFLQKMGVD